MVMDGNDLPGRDSLSDQLALVRDVRKIEVLKESHIDLLLGQAAGLLARKRLTKPDSK
jgi:hypothetical protein